MHQTNKKLMDSFFIILIVGFEKSILLFILQVSLCSTTHGKSYSIYNCSC